MQESGSATGNSTSSNTSILRSVDPRPLTHTIGTKLVANPGGFPSCTFHRFSWGRFLWILNLYQPLFFVRSRFKPLQGIFFSDLVALSPPFPKLLELTDRGRSERSQT